jgi:hypothetical protein
MHQLEPWIQSRLACMGMDRLGASCGRVFQHSGRAPIDQLHLLAEPLVVGMAPIMQPNMQA